MQVLGLHGEPAFFCFGARRLSSGAYMGRCRPAFTLVEILIVVVLLAILAAAIMPQFSTSAKDAQESSAAFSLQGLRSQIEIYKAQHAGQTPATLDKLTVRTNSQGTSGTDPA